MLSRILARLCIDFCKGRGDPDATSLGIVKKLSCRIYINPIKFMRKAVGGVGSLYKESHEARRFDMHFQRFGSEVTGTLPNARTGAAPASASFVLCPVAILAPGPWVSEIYRVALERAREAVERPWYERRLSPSVN